MLTSPSASDIHILGKVPASALALLPISLPRAVNDSLPERTFCGPMSQSGRYVEIYITAKPGQWQVVTRCQLADVPDLRYHSEEEAKVGSTRSEIYSAFPRFMITYERKHAYKQEAK
jgi:hypothetical protein